MRGHIVPSATPSRRGRQIANSSEASSVDSRQLPAVEPASPLLRSRRPGAASAFLLVLAVVGVVYPSAFIAWRVMAESIRRPQALFEALRIRWELLGSSVAYALGIAALATLIALPLAFAIRRRGASVIPLVAIPTLMPSYLAYAAWSLLRAPRTALGDAIERAAAGGFEELPLIVGRMLAILGLALWACPIAAITLGLALRRIGPAIDDALRTEGAGGIRRTATILSMARASLLSAFLLVFLVMLGSAVPLHVAQAQTYALEAWSAMTQQPGSVMPFVTAWPLTAIAMGTGSVLSRRVLHDPVRDLDDEPMPHARRRFGSGDAVAMLMWSLGVVAPLVLFATHIPSTGSFSQFVYAAGAAVRGSLGVAAGAGLVAVIISSAAYLAFLPPPPGQRRSSCVRIALAALLFAGLMPGVLVGGALLRAFDTFQLTRPIVDSPAILILASISRFGFIPALIGMFLARTEPRSLADLRALDEPRSPWGWITLVLAPRIGFPLAAGLVVALLQLYEIEAGIVLMPPGPASLAQTILNYLHYLRQDELAVASVLLVGSGLVLAMVTAIALGRSMAQEERARPSATRPSLDS